MVFEYIIKGIIVGISVSAPLGPLGILAIQRTINKGFISGFISGWGAAFADIIYAAIAGFGISIIANFLDSHQLIIRIVGGILVAIVGVKIFYTNPVRQIRKQRAQKNTFISDFISSFLITITNPLTVIFFGAVFAGLGLDKDNSGNAMVYTLLGIFLGALLWWVGLTLLVNIFRNKIRLRNLWWINKITGSIIAVFGIIIVGSIFFNFLK
ncbi:MAG: LysE family translocator [Bacteroidales bacterium]|nr:LysE family translocator [Bacteroidales bacterium]MBN2757082.1 LysE family translocator [Bacteroidales bacterium]